MNDATTNQRFQSAYQANPDAVRSMMTTTAELVCDAMERQTGVYSYDVLFNEVRPVMPNAAELGITHQLADEILRNMIQSIVDLKCQLPATAAESEKERAMVDRIIETMERHGFKTAGEALAFLRKQQLN